MPTFITIGYGDQAGYDRTDPAVRERAHAYDARLADSGMHIARAGHPVQVRNPGERGVLREDAAFMRAELPVAGFMVLEADSLEEAIELVAGTPCAVADGVVEVWPLLE